MKILPMALFSILFLFSDRVGVAQDQTVRINFVGDVMVASLPGDLIVKGQDPFASFAEIFKDSDFNVGNLETAVALAGTPLKKPYTFRASPVVVPVLKRYFNVMSLANNHTGDYGQGALLETLQHLKNGKLDYFGAGKDLTEAHAPFLFERKGLRIAVLGYNEYLPRQFEAGARRPGVAWSSEDEQVMGDIKRTRTQYLPDILIIYLHWGWENEPFPSERQKTMARRMIDAGATVVIGSHPHILQPVEYYNGHLIAYSLGNFVFDEYEDGDHNGLTGWLLRLNFDSKGLLNWDTVVSYIDSKTGFPSPVKNVKSPCGNRQSPEIGACIAVK